MTENSQNIISYEDLFPDTDFIENIFPDQKLSLEQIEFLYAVLTKDTTSLIQSFSVSSTSSQKKE
jgi:hypothetical protein